MNESYSYFARQCFAELVKTLCSGDLENADVIGWASPVPFFGDPAKSRIATMGLNPSDLEFLSDEGVELQGEKRRFQTLESLALARWSDASANDLERLWVSCRDYFRRNPYDAWFKPLDRLLEETGYSYYYELFSACHLDLSPFVTSVKWGALSASKKRILLKAGRSTLLQILGHSNIEMIVLNGKSVIDALGTVLDLAWECEEREEWRLERGEGPPVVGRSYRAWISLPAPPLGGRRVLAVGYNYNLQSSFGVTGKVRKLIARWIGEVFKENL